MLNNNVSKRERGGKKKKKKKKRNKWWEYAASANFDFSQLEPVRASVVKAPKNGGGGGDVMFGTLGLKIMWGLQYLLNWSFWGRYEQREASWLQLLGSFMCVFNHDRGLAFVIEGGEKNKAQLYM